MNLRLLFFIALAFECGASSLLSKPPCELSEADYAAVANNAKKQPLDHAAVDALNEKDAENLCKARAFVARVHMLAGPNVTELTDKQAEELGAKMDFHEIAVGTSRFVTEEEWKFIAPVVGDLMARASLGKIR